MDKLFISKVPDLSSWGKVIIEKVDEPRAHLCRILEVSIPSEIKPYPTIVHEMALAVASARLAEDLLNAWEDRVVKGLALSGDICTAIAHALARGVCASGCEYLKGNPIQNDEHFKGHLSEVLLYCMRVHVAACGEVSPVIFEPPRPKASSATGGIDLLEVGQSDGSYYFHVWECKGTDGNVRDVLTSAADQLIGPDSTAYQGFMEAHRCMIENKIMGDMEELSKFVDDMPRVFYSDTAVDSKRVGGIVGSGSSFKKSFSKGFSKKIGDAVVDNHKNCETVVVRIVDFTQFRKDVFNCLWNIF